jgi:hypothetical protein
MFGIGPQNQHEGQIDRIDQKPLAGMAPKPAEQFAVAAGKVFNDTPQNRLQRRQRQRRQKTARQIAQQRPKRPPKRLISRLIPGGAIRLCCLFPDHCGEARPALGKTV